MLEQAKVTNPNDFKVVSFHNSTEFGFTPDMGCMYDGRAINGVHGSLGIDAGEKITLPYHIGHRLAENLAKIVMLRMAPTVDPTGIPTGIPLWDTVKLENLKKSFISDLYSEAKPLAQSQTDLLMAKVEEYKKMVDTLISTKAEIPTIELSSEVIAGQTRPTDDLKVFQDKKDVIDELTKRGVKYDARQSKANLEKLLA